MARDYGIITEAAGKIRGALMNNPTIKEKRTERDPALNAMHERHAQRSNSRLQNASSRAESFQNFSESDPYMKQWSPDDRFSWSSVGQSTAYEPSTSIPMAAGAIGTFTDKVKEWDDNRRENQYYENAYAGGGRQDSDINPVFSQYGKSVALGNFDQGRSGAVQAAAASPFVKDWFGTGTDSRSRYNQRVRTGLDLGGDQTGLTPTQVEDTEAEITGQKGNKEKGTRADFYTRNGFQMPDSVVTDAYGNDVYTINGETAGYYGDDNKYHTGNMADYADAKSLALLGAENPYIAETYGDDVGRFRMEAMNDPNVSQDELMLFMGFGDTGRKAGYGLGSMGDIGDVVGGYGDLLTAGYDPTSLGSRDALARIQYDDWADPLLSDYGGIYGADFANDPGAWRQVYDYMNGLDAAKYDLYGANGDTQALAALTGDGALSTASTADWMVNHGYHPLFDAGKLEDEEWYAEHPDVWNWAMDYAGNALMGEDYDGNTYIDLDPNNETGANKNALLGKMLYTEASLNGALPNEYTTRILMQDNPTYVTRDPDWKPGQASDLRTDFMELPEDYNPYLTSPEDVFIYGNANKLLGSGLKQFVPEDMRYGWRAWDVL